MVNEKKHLNLIVKYINNIYCEVRTVIDETGNVTTRLYRAPNITLPEVVDVRSQPSQLLLRQRDRVRHLATAPEPPKTVPKLSVAELQLLQNRENQRQANLEAKRQLFLQQRQSQTVMPKVLTEQERENVRLKKEKINEEYEATVLAAQALGTVKNLMQTLGMRENAGPRVLTTTSTTAQQKEGITKYY